MTIDIAAIRRREQAATPGPWVAHPDGLVWAQGPGDPVSGSTETADAEFIAHARQDIPALVNEIKRMRAVVEAAKTWRKNLIYTSGAESAALVAAVDALTEAVAR